ncbi:hypothetical protein I4U23_009469 [Adineta vaga]|nr:hypothetical protein I4U23_009469 [Adineta vaga]
MGGGAGKSKPKPVNQPVQQVIPPPLQQNVRNISPLPTMPVRTNLSPVEEQTDFRTNRTSSRNSLKSSKQNKTTLDDSIENDSTVDEDHLRLPPINNSFGKSKSRSVSKASTPSVAPVSIRRPLTGSSTSSVSHVHHHRKHSATHHGQDGRYCSHCPHCRRRNDGEPSLPPTPPLKWLTEKPNKEDLSINMDDYDIEAVKKKILKETGHLPGSYDYQPQLTIEQTNDYDSTKENYYTLPFVAKTAPYVSATRTPFPDYNVLQRKERRINKPYTISLFAD